MVRLEGKVALVSGGARGMGAQFAQAIVAEGGKVVIGDVLDDEGRATATKLGDAAIFTHLDVTNRDDWEAAVAKAVETFGRLNVLINNAGISSFGNIEDYTHEQWEKIIAINLTGVFNGIKAAIPALKDAAPSSIINISSTAGIRGYQELPGYTASKFGVRGLTQSAALDLGRYNIRVNSVHPGTIRTPMTENLGVTNSHVSLGRVGEPHEVANLIVFLASDESSFSTGAEFKVDGGETAGLIQTPAGQSDSADTASPKAA